MSHPLLNEIDDILTEDWAASFVYDDELALSKGMVILRYKDTNRPAVVRLTMSLEGFENKKFTRRELRRQIKEAAPTTILNIRISEINHILRNAARRSFKEVEKDFAKWMKKVSEDLETFFGEKISNTFEKATILPPSIRPGSLQSLQFLIENKIDQLKEF
ncbi:MAG: hypothetical protein J0L93_02840 [Deltaproteobacteria bacterium]|nr:hypothetical protein [Deltaproteobacteria bacterium]